MNRWQLLVAAVTGLIWAGIGYLVVPWLAWVGILAGIGALLLMALCSINREE